MWSPITAVKQLTAFGSPDENKAKTLRNTDKQPDAVGKDGDCGFNSRSTPY